MPESAGVYRHKDRPNRHMNRPKSEVGRKVEAEGQAPLRTSDLVGNPPKLFLETDFLDTSPI